MFSTFVMIVRFALNVFFPFLYKKNIYPSGFLCVNLWLYDTTGAVWFNSYAYLHWDYPKKRFERQRIIEFVRHYNKWIIIRLVSTFDAFSKHIDVVSILECKLTARNHPNRTINNNLTFKYEEIIYKYAIWRFVRLCRSSFATSSVVVFGKSKKIFLIFLFSAILFIKMMTYLLTKKELLLWTERWKTNTNQQSVYKS